MKRQGEEYDESNDPPPSYSELEKKSDWNSKNKIQFNNINDKRQDVESRINLISPSAPPLLDEIHDRDLETLHIALQDLPSTVKFNAESNFDRNNLPFLIRDYITNCLVAKGQVDKKNGHIIIHSATNGTIIFSIKDTLPGIIAPTTRPRLRTYHIHIGEQLVGTIIELKRYNSSRLTLNEEIMANMVNLYEESTYSIKFVTKEDLIVFKDNNNSSSSTPTPLCKIHVPFVHESAYSFDLFDAVINFSEHQASLISNIEKCLCLAVPIVFMSARNILPRKSQEQEQVEQVLQNQTKSSANPVILCLGIIVIVCTIFIVCFLVFGN